MDLKNLIDTVASWPEVTVHAHRFGGREFRYGSAEIGHAHNGGVVDNPFPRAVHDALLEEGLAEEHRWVPNSGWVTFRVGRDEDLEHALWLMRLSYLRYALKASVDPHRLLEKESGELKLSPRFVALLKKFVRSTPAAAEPITA